TLFWFAENSPATCADRYGSQLRADRRMAGGDTASQDAEIRFREAHGTATCCIEIFATSIKSTDTPNCKVGTWRTRSGQDRVFNNAFASCKSAVSNPSVNQP